MIGTLIKAVAYTQAPKTTFSLLHPVAAVQVVKVPFDLKTAYAPWITAAATALVVAPLAYRLGRRAGEGTLFATAADPVGAPHPGGAAPVPVAAYGEAPATPHLAPGT